MEWFWGRNKLSVSFSLSKKREKRKKKKERERRKRENVWKSKEPIITCCNDQYSLVMIMEWEEKQGEKITLYGRKKREKEKDRERKNFFQRNRERKRKNRKLCSRTHWYKTDHFFLELIPKVNNSREGKFSK